MSGVTNTAIYRLLEGQVLATLAQLQEGQVEMNQHLARLNGKVENLERRAESHTGRLRDHGGKIEDFVTRLAVVEAVGNEREKWQDSELVEAKGERKELLARLWEVSKAVAEMGVLLAAMTKVLGVW